MFHRLGSIDVENDWNLFGEILLDQPGWDCIYKNCPPLPDLIHSFSSYSLVIFFFFFFS